jgi:peroxiredoxin
MQISKRVAVLIAVVLLICGYLIGDGASFFFNKSISRKIDTCFSTWMFSQLMKQVELTQKKQSENIGSSLPITFTALDGQNVDLSKLKGKVVLIDFWATWCGPCVAELPDVKKAYEEFHSQGFEVIGISFDKDRSKLERFIKDQEMPWPQYFDGKGWENQFGKQYDIRSIPTMWLIGKDGKLADVTANQNLTSKIKKLIGIPSAN